ncbi:hypothetical protein PVK06_023791 [Gossypium arboreum]|uniref:Uncharacterized protein n=1 Tax=Gossypium arboreum TaxID=29729 RepID=A0ABR0PCF8_GOSAR|nr:hypothetical protein PVK06_023791 [Gossypium arboreum]
MESQLALQKQADHTLHFNPTFKENSFVNVEVKEGVLEAKNHSTVVFSNKSLLENVTEVSGGILAGINLSNEIFKGHNSKKTGSEGGWDKPHLVEAIGFSRGIRIRWKNSIDLEVVDNHLQFILTRICPILVPKPKP